MKKKIRDLFIFLLFGATWVFLFRITGNPVPWQIGGSSGGNGISVSLGDVPAQNYDRMGFTGGFIQYVKKDRSWIVGTDRGEIFRFDDQGRQMWKHAVGDGSIVSMKLSDDESVIYAGERSASGFLYAIDADNGNVLWKYASSQLIGADPMARSEPAPVHLSTDREGRVYANFHRFVMNQQGSRSYQGRVVAFDRRGQVLWMYPAHENLDSWINWNDVSDGSGRVVFSTSNYETDLQIRYHDTLYVLNRDTGEKEASVLLPGQPLSGAAVMRGSPNFSADGQTMAGAASDGRAFLFDSQGHVLWMRFLARPAYIQGSWINAVGRDGFVISEGVVFTTINTFNRENWQLPTPVIHPGSNSLFLFSPEGQYRFKYTARGEIESVSFVPGMAVLAVGRNVRTHDYTVHGAVAVSLSDGKELNFFSTDGPLQAAAVSDDGRQIAGIEAPAVTPEGKLIGAYRFHLWNRF